MTQETLRKPRFYLKDLNEYKKIPICVEEAIYNEGLQLSNLPSF